MVSEFFKSRIDKDWYDSDMIYNYTQDIHFVINKAVFIFDPGIKH